MGDAAARVTAGAGDVCSERVRLAVPARPGPARRGGGRGRRSRSC